MTDLMSTPAFVGLKQGMDAFLIPPRTLSASETFVPVSCAARAEASMKEHIFLRPRLAKSGFNASNLPQWRKNLVASNGSSCVDD